MPVNRSENQELGVRKVKYPKKSAISGGSVNFENCHVLAYRSLFFPYNFHLQPMNIRKNAPVGRSITGDNFALRIYPEHEHEDFHQF